MSGRLPSMSVEAVTVVCPHCDRSYRIKIDAARLARVRTRAGCQRCGRSFDVASCIRPGAGAEGAPGSAPKPPPPSMVLGQSAVTSPPPRPRIAASLPPRVASEPVPTGDFDGQHGSEPSIRHALARSATLAAAASGPGNAGTQRVSSPVASADPGAGWIDFVTVGVDAAPTAQSPTIGLLARLLVPTPR